MEKKNKTHFIEREERNKMDTGLIVNPAHQDIVDITQKQAEQMLGKMASDSTGSGGFGFGTNALGTSITSNKSQALGVSNGKKSISIERSFVST